MLNIPFIIGKANKQKRFVQEKSPITIFSKTTLTCDSNVGLCAARRKSYIITVPIASTS